MGEGKTGATRLDGLIDLLQNGTNASVRRMAAGQIGEVVAAHPSEVRPILRRIRKLLRIQAWETRIAAGHALASVASHTPKYVPPKAVKTESMEVDSNDADVEMDDGRQEPKPPSAFGRERPMLVFEKLDIVRILEGGTLLFGSSGDEYKVANIDIAQQRARLKADLGLDDKFAVGDDSMLGLKDEDLDVVTPACSNNVPTKRKSADDIFAELAGDKISKLSAREKNRLRRQAKKQARQQSTQLEPDGQAVEYSQEVPADKGEDPAKSSDGTEAVDNDIELGALGWEFQPTCEVLKKYLLESRWETRHGAAVGLREILKHHASSAGRYSADPMLGNEENLRWLEDTVCRLLCVLALDRFGDFVGDAVVAPVRETAAMAISVASKDMAPERINLLLQLILHLLESAKKQSKWEVRHAALLGVRYLLAVRSDLASTLIPTSFDAISNGLTDEDDDVRAVAAEALFPVADSLVRILDHRKISGLIANLWDALLELDDISASTGAILRLLARLTRTPVPDGAPPMWLSQDALNSMMHSQVDDIEDENTNMENDNGQHVLVKLIPRLWPFLRHHSVSVRRAAISLVEALFEASGEEHFAEWIEPLCSGALERIYKNVVLESDEEALRVSKKVWFILLSRLGKNEGSRAFLCNSAASFIKEWLLLASHETRGEAVAFDKSRNVCGKARTHRKKPVKKARRSRKAAKTEVDSSGAAGEVEGPYEGTEMQYNAADALGMLAVLWPPTNPKFSTEVFNALQSPFATARRVGCDVCRMWETHANGQVELPDAIKQSLVGEMQGSTKATIAELGLSTGSLFSDTSSLLDAMQPAIRDSYDTSTIRNLAERGKQCTSSGEVVPLSFITIDLLPHATDLAKYQWSTWETHVRESKIKKRRRETVESLRLRVLSGIGYVQKREEELRRSLSAAAAAALVSAECDPLPKTVTPYIKPLMECVKKAKNPVLRKLVALSLARLAVRLSDRESRKPIAVLLKNIFRNLTGATVQSGTDGLEPSDSIQVESLAIAQSGAAETLQAMCNCFDIHVFSKLPWLWDYISDPARLKPQLSENGLPDSETLKAQRNALVVIKTIVGNLHQGLHDSLATLLPWITACATAGDVALAHEAALCLAEFVVAVRSKGMEAVIQRLTPLLSGASEHSRTNAEVRRGAAGAICTVVNRLGTSVIPYAAFLIIPMMQRMVDDDHEVRQLSAKVFGTLVRLIPLEGSAPDDPDMTASMSSERELARGFLGQLLGTEPRSHYTMPIAIAGGITLRKYQQECLDWLAFLNRYGLHGALCDDMGLGKTLMTLCILAGTYYSNQTSSNNSQPAPSLVVCPSTIVAHWFEECSRFFGHVLNPVLMYSGSPKMRAKIRSNASFAEVALIITSYDTLSKDIAHFVDIRFNYVVLDEGHVIKNPKTKNSQAVRKISAAHRLILTGTPIQNSVLELWSMFDFLMPGFLGTEHSFKDHYSKPILASRDAKCTERHRERGLLAMETLHRQVLPFILRRVKDDVLSELPPKIIQDYHCDMTPLQLRLYEDFSKQFVSANEQFEADASSGRKKKRGNSTFQALQYLRRLCSHPRLVLTEKHPEYINVMNDLRASGESLHNVAASSKLVALKNLLTECGVGDTDGVQESAGHRVLIFAQLKAMLDIVESDLFKSVMPSVTYLRLDGSVDTSKRQGIVTRFNSDPTIDCLLLTTQVGGLGLNLTGADTVIFLEHDWNPTKDLQAMDRAHRLGQKRTVNVYRLVTRGTLEEKILGVQKFKTHIANTVVNRENSALQNMNTDELLNLFQCNTEGMEQDDGKGAGTGKGSGLKAVLETVGDLWDETQYADEYDMNGFLADMQGVFK